MATKTDTPQQTEVEKIEEWRLHVASEAGAPYDVAREVAHDQSVDLHRFVELIRDGCSPATAYKILA